MNIPEITGIIDRRILINYRVNKDILDKYLPDPFKPKTYRGYGIVGICLIRLKEIRPLYIPKLFGISSENGAHRIAVEWRQGHSRKEGVYIPRRDTSSTINFLAGDRIFPGKHHHSKFQVEEQLGNYKVFFENKDKTYLKIEAHESDNWNEHSIFSNIEEASDFFQTGSLGYSPWKNNFIGLELHTHNWEVSALKISNVDSSFFDNKQVFPEGSITFDNALLMKNIHHSWIQKGKLL